MDDDLTPVEPEFREEPPSTPPEDPNYYGTGRPPRQKKSHLPLILTLCVVLLTANLLTVIVALTREDEPKPCQTETIGKLVPGENAPVAEEPEAAEPPPLLDQHTSLQGIYDAISPSTVVVIGKEDYSQYVYTGVILTEDGYLMTTAEAVGKELKVILNDGTDYVPSYVGIDGDAVVLKIDSENLQTVPLKKEDNLRVQQVIASVRNREEKRPHLELKIADLPTPLRIIYELPEGVIVDDIAENSSAYEAGIRGGDVLLGIGEKRVRDIAGYLNALQQYSWGETVRVYVFRSGETYRTDILLENREP